MGSKLEAFSSVGSLRVPFEMYFGVDLEYFWCLGVLSGGSGDVIFTKSTSEGFPREFWRVLVSFGGSRATVF